MDSAGISPLFIIRKVTLINYLDKNNLTAKEESVRATRINTRKNYPKHYLNVDQNKVNESNISKIKKIMTIKKHSKIKNERLALAKPETISYCRFLKYILKQLLCRKVHKRNSDLFYALKLIDKFSSYDFILNKTIETEIFKKMFLTTPQIFALSAFKKINKDELIDAHKFFEIEDEELQYSLMSDKNDDSNAMTLLSIKEQMSHSQKESFTKLHFNNILKLNEFSQYDDTIISHLSHDLRDKIHLDYLELNKSQ